MLLKLFILQKLKTNFTLFNYMNIINISFFKTSYFKNRFLASILKYIHTKIFYKYWAIQVCKTSQEYIFFRFWTVHILYEIHHRVRRNKYSPMSITHPESNLNKEIRVYWTHAEAKLSFTNKLKKLLFYSP